MLRLKELSLDNGWQENLEFQQEDLILVLVITSVVELVQKMEIVIVRVTKLVQRW